MSPFARATLPQAIAAALLLTLMGPVLAAGPSPGPATEADASTELAAAPEADAAPAEDEAAAQDRDEDPAALSAITVTAQRRAESIQEVPIAISAFGGADLERLNIDDALDVMQYVPNVIGHNNTGLASANTYYIRGLGNTESLATQDPPVGTYVDEIYLSRQSANNVALLDVERVEVLRGPQGTLFGRNTTGGAINVVLNRPDENFGGFAEAGIGSFQERLLRASVNVPIAPAVAAKVSIYDIENEGYVRNAVTGEKLNGEDNRGGRIALRAALSDTLVWNLSAIDTENVSANLVNFECNPAQPTQCDRRYATTGLRIDNGGANQLAPVVLANGKGSLPLGAETRFNLFSSNLEWSVGGAVLNAITGYVDTEQDFLLDFFDGRAAPTITFGTDPASGRPTRFNTGTNIVAFPPVRGLASGGFVIANKADSRQFTQEFKLTGAMFEDRLRYVGGLFYYDEDNETDFADVLTSATTRAPLLLADRIVDNSTEAYAAYFQADYDLTDEWKLTAGIRYTDEKKSFDFSDNRPQCRATPLPATCIDSRNLASVDVDANPATPNVPIPLDQRAKIWTPRFAANYTPSDTLLWFASATKGFKSGSHAARATTLRQLLPVGPEKVWSYELGMKSDWFDRRLRFNATAFLQDTEDFQGGTAFVNPVTGQLTFVTRNLADLENRGLELEFEARPIDGLTLSLAAGLQDIEFQIDEGAPPVDGFGFLSVAAQLAECRAALAGQASPRGISGTATARAQASCSGIVATDGNLADPVRAPDLTLTFGIAYDIALGAWDATLTPSLYALYVDDQEVGTNNLSVFRSDTGVLNFAGEGDFILGSFAEANTKLNANLMLQANDGRWAVIASCDNCTDEAEPQSTLSNYSYLNPPRSYSLRLRWNF